VWPEKRRTPNNTLFSKPGTKAQHAHVQAVRHRQERLREAGLYDDAMTAYEVMAGADEAARLEAKGRHLDEMPASRRDDEGRARRQHDHARVRQPSGGMTMESVNFVGPNMTGISRRIAEADRQAAERAELHARAATTLQRLDQALAAHRTPTRSGVVVQTVQCQHRPTRLDVWVQQP